MRGHVRGFHVGDQSRRAYARSMTHRVERVIETACPIERAFDFVADFSTTEEWDPGIPSARRLDDRPIGPAAASSCSRGSARPSRRSSTRSPPSIRPTSVTFVGDGKHFQGHRRDLVRPGQDGGTRVTYVADLGLKGLSSLALPFIRGRLDEMSDRAVAGLKTALDARA